MSTGPERQVLAAVLKADQPCTMHDVVMATPLDEAMVRETVRAMLNRGLLRLTIDWRIVADSEPELGWSDFEYRSNPVSYAADKVRMELSHLSIEDAFTAVKRVYDEMRGVVIDGGAVHDQEENHGIKG